MIIVVNGDEIPAVRFLLRGPSFVGTTVMGELELIVKLDGRQ